MEKATPKEIQDRAVSAIIEEGVPFTVTVDKPTFLHRLRILPSKRTFTIYPLKLGTVLKISSVILSMDDMDVELNKAESSLFDVLVNSVSRNAEKMVSILTIAVQNNEKPPATRTKRFFMENLTPVEMLKIINLVIRQMDLTDFFRSIASMRGANILMKARKANGQTSGASSGESSNTSGSAGMKSSGSEAGPMS